MADRMRWLGHSTVLVELDGVLRAHRPAPAQAGAAPSAGRAARRREAFAVDVVLLSHLHYDHLDLPSLRRLDRGTPLVVPRAGARSSRARASGRSSSSRPARRRPSATSPSAPFPPSTVEPHRGQEGRGARLRGGGLARCLLRRRHRPLPRHGRAGGRPRRALLPIWGWGPSIGPGTSTRAAPGGARHPSPARRGPDPLGDLLPAHVCAADAAAVPQRAGQDFERAPQSWRRPSRCTAPRGALPLTDTGA